MKKIILLFAIIFAFTFCDEPGDTVIAPETSVFVVQGVSNPGDVYFDFENPYITVNVRLSNDTNVEGVLLAEMSEVDKSSSVVSSVELKDDGKFSETGDFTPRDNTYTGKLPLDEELLSGRYEVRFYNSNDLGKTLLGTSYLMYDDLKENDPPVLSEVNGPDTIFVTGSAGVGIFEASVSDPDGMDDIDEVFFVTIREDGTSSGTRYPLMDDGDFDNSGDQVANDGIYSVGVRAERQNIGSVYKLEFQAVDRKGNKSGTITKEVVIAE